jgi:hypothetical protein
MPQQEVDRVVLARVQLARREARDREAPLAPASVLALQRHAGNQAVVALLARQAGGVRGRVSSPTLQRQGPYEGESAGCGFCIDPAPAGVLAHELIQSKMGSAGVDNEVKDALKKKGRFRLDLARWDDKTIEIGEIKPGNPEGFARGHAELDYYKGVIEKSNDPKFKGKAVSMLGDPAPKDQVFPNPGVSLPEEQTLKCKNDAGVYGYWCEPSNRQYFEAAGLTKRGKKGSTLEALRLKKAFFDSDCIKKKTKRQPVEEERIKIVDRAGAVRLARRALAIGILQSRAFHLNREVELLAGEHKLLYEHWKKTITMGALGASPLAAPFVIPAAVAAIWTGMPDLEIWAPARAAGAKAAGAGDVESLAKALDELERAIVQPRQEFLTFKARRDGTKPPADPNATPAPASGAGAPPPGAPPPLPPPKAADQGAHAQGGGATAPAQEAGGLSPTTIAVLAVVVVITVLLLQPEVGAAAVAAAGTEAGVGAAGAAVGADAAAAAGGGILVDGAAVAAEAALEAEATELVAAPLVGAL